MGISWWNRYYHIVSEDTYFNEAYNSPAYGHYYDTIQMLARISRVTILDYLLAYESYFERLYEINPMYTCPIYMKDTSGRTFIGYFQHGRLYRLNEYTIEYAVI